MLIYYVWFQYCAGFIEENDIPKVYTCKMCQSNTLALERYKCEYCPKTGPSISPLFPVKYVRLHS